MAIRYPRGGAVKNYSELGLEPDKAKEGFDKSANVLAEGTDVCIWSYGNMLEHGAKAIEILAEKGVNAGLVDSRFIVPFDKKTLIETGKKAKLIVTLEDGVLDGGFGETVNTVLVQEGISVPVINIGWPKEFIEHGSASQLMELYKIDSSSIAERILDKIEK